MKSKCGNEQGCPVGFKNHADAFVSSSPIQCDCRAVRACAERRTLETYAGWSQVCVAYSRSALSLPSEIKQEVQDVVTAFEGLGIQQRHFLERT